MASFSSLFFPRYCLSCNSEGHVLCLECVNGWIARPEPSSCPGCGKYGSPRMCFTCRETHALDGLSFYLPYGNSVLNRLIRTWKYVGDRSVELHLQRWLRADADRLRPPFDSFVVVPVPTDRRRARARGFDQAEVIAEWASDMYQMPIARLLLRSRSAPAQAQQLHQDRLRRSFGSLFETSPFCSVPPARVLLCDDVYTSGATMDAAAGELKKMGVKEVWGITIGRG